MGIRLVTGLRRVKQGLLPAALLALAIPTAGQPGDDRNAAAWYGKAVERFGDAGLTDADWTALRGYRPETGDVPSDAVRAALQRLRPVFSAVERGSRQAVSDFDLDYAQGFGLRMPHLGPLRSLSGLMAKDAMVRLHDGDAAGAAASIASLYRVGDHLADDGVMISSLVGQAIFTEADRAAQAGIDRSAFGPAESETLLQAVETFDPRDPFDISGAVGNEQFIVGWVRDKYEDPGERTWMLDDFTEFGMGAEAANVVAGMMLIDQAAFDTALEETDAVMGRLAEVFALDDAAAAQFELQKIAEAIDRGEHGPLAKLIVPDVTGVHRKMIDAQRVVAERKALLKAVIDGDIAAESLANAAVWYLRALDMLATLPQEATTHFDRINDDPSQYLEDAALKAFANTAPIVDTLRDGSLKQRCDFSIAPGAKTAAIPPYLPGLRDAARLLHADAVRHLRQGEPAAAAGDLAICFRLSAHLAGDNRIPSALASHVIFNRTVELAVWGAEAFDTEQLARLERATQTTGDRDPFGYLAGQAAARREILDALRLGADPAVQARLTVHRLDGDRLMYMLVVTGRDEIKLPETEPLDDVISLEALALALTEVQRVRAELAETGDLGAIAAREVPDIGRVNKRLARAQSDRRKATTTLRR